MKKILSCFIVFAMMLFTFVGCSKNDKDTLEDGVLTVGYTIYDPMNYYDDEGDFVGFDTELALEVGKLLDVEIEFVEINWDNKVMALDSYEIDAVWNGMTITEELKDAMSITDSYLENRQVVVCRKGEESRFDTKEEIKNAKEVVVEALDLDGNKVKLKAKDLLAQALCHEIDHLDGHVFVEIVKPGTLETMKPKENEE